MRIGWSDIKWLFGIVCLAGAIAGSSVISYASKDHGLNDQFGNHSDIYEDLVWLFDVMKQWSDSDMSFTALGYGNIQVDKSPADVLNSLLADYDEVEYTSTADSATGLVTLSDHTMLSATVQKYAESQALVAVKLISSQLDDLSDYPSWLAAMKDHLAKSRIGLDWRLNVQSTLQHSLSPKQVWETLDAYGATSVPSGEYRDANSISRTFYVPYLASEARVRGHLVSVQAAVHQSTTDGTYRVTLGTPLITVEY